MRLSISFHPCAYSFPINSVRSIFVATLNLKLGGGSGSVLDTGVPVLGETNTEVFLPDGTPRASAGVFSLFETGDWLVGGATVTVDPGLEAITSSLYAELLRVGAGWHLARIWNYVPAINAAGPDGLENYRAFSRGRSLAFEQCYGEQFTHRVPAASAVGTMGSALTVVFVASRTPVDFVENPLQIPAYRYPEEYGPRPPSFARSAVVKTGTEFTVYISGTAAVRGHETRAPMNTSGQLDCTLENLREISIASGLGPDLGADPARGGGHRIFKVYIRDPRDYPLIADTLAARLLQPGDVVSYVQSDICRDQLTVEIEVTVGIANPLRASIASVASGG